MENSCAKLAADLFILFAESRSAISADASDFPQTGFPEGAGAAASAGNTAQLFQVTPVSQKVIQRRTLPITPAFVTGLTTGPDEVSFTLPDGRMAAGVIERRFSYEAGEPHGVDGFRLEGMEATVIYDGAQAVEAVRRLRPDLVLMDLGMPRMSGFHAPKILRSEMPHLPLVALSGWGTEEDRKGTADAGFTEHLVKPASPVDVRLVMERRR